MSKKIKVKGVSSKPSDKYIHSWTILFFVFWVRDLKIVLAYLFNSADMCKGEPYKMLNIKVVQSSLNFAQFSKIKNKQVAKFWGI